MVQTPDVHAAGALAGRHIVLGLSGGVACYKVAELARLLIKAGASVQVLMTPAAEAFITAVTLQALTGRAVYTSQWDARPGNNMAHINATRDADALLIAPASADMLAKLAHGQADELVSLSALARPAHRLPLFVAPAMNVEMWQAAPTQRNIAQLRSDGVHILGPGCGDQACGEVGDGRMLEPSELLAALVSHFSSGALAGRRMVITAGPTYEAIDPVRGITNRSSGKMGFALARAAREAGAQVTLIAGPVALPTPAGVARVDVVSAREMLAAVQQAVGQGCDAFIATAAVADWRPADVAEQKIKKSASGQPPALTFIENPDILATIAKQPGAPYCVGFAAESENVVEHAKAKRLRKGIPLILANHGPSTFGADDNALVLIDAQGQTELPRASKIDLARQVVAELARRLPAPRTP